MPLNKSAQPPRFQVDNIFFRLKLFKALIPIKFKCRFLVEIKTTSATSPLKTLAKSKDQYRQVASIINFDVEEAFEFSHYMVYDNDMNRYKKTEIQIIVSLISDNRGEEVKLVGRIRVDLNEFMIDNRGERVRREQELENCSVKKPQIAKLQYELSLVGQQKMNINQNPDREVIYSQIDRGIFTDALEYNQFGKQVFGKDFSILNINKINRSLNDSVSRVNGSNDDIVREKTEKALTKEIINGPLNEKKQQGMKYDEDHSLKGSSNVAASIEKAPKKQTQKSPQLQVTIEQNQQRYQQSAPSQKAKIVNSNPVTNKQQSPRKKGQSIKPASQQITQVQPPSQSKNNFLTQSMFEEQQIVIQSLHQQLQQAREIIQQYKLEMDLMKEETERLENQKSIHASELETSRARNQSVSGFLPHNDNPFQNQCYALRQRLQQYQQELQENKKAFQQKDEIIDEKNQVIANLNTQIQMAAHQMELKIYQKDQAFKHFYQQFTLVEQERTYLKSELDNTKQLYEKKCQDNTLHQITIDQLKTQLQQLTNTAKDSLLSQLNADLAQKNQRILQLQLFIQQQKTNIVQFQLKVSDLETKIGSLTKLIEEQKLQQVKWEQMAKKYSDSRDKTEQQMNKALEKARAIEKEKYELGQQIAAMSLNTRNLDKLVDEKIQTYKTQYDQLAISYKQAQNKIIQLKFALQSYKQTVNLQQIKSQSQIKQLTQKLQNFNKKQHLLRQSLDLLQNQTTQIRNFVQQKQASIRQCQDLIRQKDQQLAEKNDKLNYLQRKQRMTENTINDLKLQLKLAQAINLNDERQLSKDGEDQLQTRLFVLNQANMQLLQKQKQMTQIIDEKDHANNELQKKIATIDPLKRQISLLQNRLSSSQQKYLQLRDQLKTLSQKDLQQNSKSDQQSSQLEHAYQQCEKLQQQLSSIEEEKANLFCQLQQKELDLLQLQQATISIKENIKTLEKQLQSKDSQLKKVQRQLQYVQKVNQELKQKISHIQASHISENNRIHQLLIDSRMIISQDQQPISAIKSLAKENYSSPCYTRSKEEQEIYRLTEQLEAYKQREESYMCNVLDLQEQLEIAKKEKLSSSAYDQRQSIRKSQSLQSTGLAYDKNGLKIACDKLEKLIEQRIKNRETQNLIQMIVSNSQILGGLQQRTGNQQGTLFARQKNNLQEKSRILSRQVQKIKSLIFKKSDLPYKNKTEIIQLLKPCQNITNELIKIAQNFAKQSEEQREIEK